jgi:hypothetical protein
MYLFYVDESGSVPDPTQVFFILAGVAIFDRQVHWVGQELDKIAARFNPGDPDSVELHGSPMLKGRGFWRKFPLAERKLAIKDALDILAGSPANHTVFACVIRKSIILADPVEKAFEQIASRFDYFLKRSYRKNGDRQRGLIIFDKSIYETTIQSLAINFKRIGHTWNVLRNLAEVPLFLDSKASRLIQLADLVAYSIYQKYEQGNDEFYAVIKSRFDKDGTQIHGLCEIIESGVLYK